MTGIHVDKVTVQYVYEGTRYEVEFDPAAEEGGALSLYFSREEVARSRGFAGGQPEKVPARGEWSLPGVRGPRVVEQGAEAGSGDTLCWHDSNCMWFCLDPD